MNTNVTPMACGNCGNGLFRMFQRPGTVGFELLAECSKCMSITIIKPTPAELQLCWGEGSAGRLCTMEPTERASLSASQLLAARMLVANRALTMLEIPNYTVLNAGEWRGDSTEAVLRSLLEISATGTPRGPAVTVSCVVRFDGAHSAEFLEALVLVLGGATVLASLSKANYRPNPDLA